jgi:hypothetical protein
MAGTERAHEDTRHQPAGTAPASQAADHEHSDVDVRGILMFVAGLGLTCVVSFWLMVMLFNYYSGRALASDPPAPALTAVTREAPPEPRLQTTPAPDLAAFRAGEDAKLHGYAWVDKPTGVVRIPIERAMELIVERGLPATSGPVQPAPPAPAPPAPPR